MVQPGTARPIAASKRLPFRQGNFLCWGDNRDNSKDSRVFGLVSADQVMGRAFAVAFSMNYDNYYLPRGSVLPVPLTTRRTITTQAHPIEGLRTSEARSTAVGIVRSLTRMLRLGPRMAGCRLERQQTGDNQ